MDLSLLPATLTEYNTHRTGARFTVRSANSISYSRRAGVRRRETTRETGAEQYGTNVVTNHPNTDEDRVAAFSSGSLSSVKGQYAKREASGYKMTVKLNDTEDKTAPVSGSDRGADPTFERRGRTEWKRNTFSYRSRSVDCRTEEKSPDRRSKAFMSTLSPKRGADISRRASSAMERTRFEGGVMEKVAHMSQTLKKENWTNSLPSRWNSGPNKLLSDTSSSLGLKGGQSILERIEKLYGSAGLSKVDDPKMRDSSMSETSMDALISSQRKSDAKTTGGTFPRRFSADFNSPVKGWIPLIWTQNNSSMAGSHELPSPPRASIREKTIGGQWQGHTWSRCSDGGGGTWAKGFVDSGTRSLDRARSKNTVAAQIRAARAAAATPPSQHPSNVFTGTSALFRDSDRFTERRASGIKSESFGEKNETNKTNGLSKERIGRVRSQEEDKEMAGRMRFKSSTIDEEVFEANPQRGGERKKITETFSASVRNKINQFEALTQTGQGPETNQASMPRRTFSVPTQLGRCHDGVKKSRSAKDVDGLRNRKEGLTVGGDADDKEKVMGSGKGSARSLSLDEVGLRLEKKESEDNDVDEQDKSNQSNDFEKYSRLKNTLEIPLHGGPPMKSKRFFIDETDFFKVSSPEGENINNKSSVQLSGNASAAQKVLASPERESLIPDEDKTPTNTPDHSPFLPPTTQVEDATPNADSQNKHSFVFTHESNNPDAATPALPGPLASSPVSNLSELVSSDVTRGLSKGRKQLMDLDAWITGLNPEFKGWSYEEDDDDDDESTQKDDDSTYDSDSGESSVTITSCMSQSDRRSFSVNLSDLCNFTGVDSESDDSDEWQSGGRRSASLSSDISALSYVSVMPAEELDRLLEDVKSLGNNTLQDYSDVQVVVLHKDVGVGLGFSMAGGVDQNKPITVHKVFHLGVAAKEGSIREGDRVLSINGTALQGTAHWEALRVLRRAKAREMGVVVLRRDDVTGPPKRGVPEKSQEPTQPQLETGQRVCVQLQKNSRDLGFSLEGGVGSSEGNRPLTVQKVFLGGPVDKVCSGDEILEIEGTSVVAMRRLEVWILIRSLPAGPVDVVLRRHPNLPET